MILLLAGELYTQVIDQIILSGEMEFKRSDYLAWTKISEGSRLIDRDTILKNISLGLSEQGYFNPGLKVAYLPGQDSQRVNLSLDIIEGEPTRINSIILRGGDSTSNLMFSAKLEFLRGDILKKSELENNIIEIIEYYEDEGFPFAGVKINSIYFFEDTVTYKPLADIYLSIDTGRTSRIDKIEISGNEKTKDFVILRDIGIKEGQYYSQKNIDEIPKQLNRLRFFEPVENPTFYFNSGDEGVLVINVKEKQTNNFDGLVGYVPGNNLSEKAYVTGLVNVSLRNLFGTARAAAFKWQRLDRYSQELDIRYLEPWIGGYPFNIGIELFQLKQDTTYVQRRLEGTVEFLATENISASVIVSTESVIPSESENSVFTVYNSSIINTGFNLKIDTRDDYYAPTEGFYFLNSYTFSRKKINGPAQYLSQLTERNLNFQKFAVDFNYFRAVFKRNIIAVGLHGREIRGSILELSDLFRLGGTNSLRGYRENQFLGNRILWGNLEYRVLLSARTYAFAFFDMGYYLRDEDTMRKIPEAAGTKHGWGLGLNLETGLGVLGVSYALGKGDSFSSGKIHFGLINEF